MVGRISGKSKFCMFRVKKMDDDSGDEGDNKGISPHHLTTTRKSL